MNNPFTHESDPSDRGYDNWAYPADHDLHTAQHWTLHVRVDPSQVGHTIERVLASGAEVLTGDYCGGDSFAEWCEPLVDWREAFGAAVHIYYSAPTLTSAISRGRALATIAGLHSAVDATISTAGDWSQQAEVFYADAG